MWPINRCYKNDAASVLWNHILQWLMGFLRTPINAKCYYLSWTLVLVMDEADGGTGWWTARLGLSEGWRLSETNQGLADDVNTWLHYHFQMMNALHLALRKASSPPRVGTSKHLQHATVLSKTRHKRKIEHMGEEPVENRSERNTYFPERSS